MGYLYKAGLSVELFPCATVELESIITMTATISGFIRNSSCKNFDGRFRSRPLAAVFIKESIRCVLDFGPTLGNVADQLDRLP